MAGIFPRNGLLPGVDNTGAPLTVAPPAGCEALYYNERCAQKIDPRALNALISEIVNVFNCKGFQYDCSRQDNLARILCAVTPPYSGCVLSATRVFAYTGAEQTYTPPEGVSKLVFRVWGAGGGGASVNGVGAWQQCAKGGAGGYAEWTTLVVGGPYLVVVGGGGQVGGAVPTFGGGGRGGAASPSGPYPWPGASGGGLSGIFSGTFTPGGARLIAGGGGGGSGGDEDTDGGPGGGLVGGAGTPGNSGHIGGGGGSQVAGGAGAPNGGAAGTALQGGAGANDVSGGAGGGGGGGGGWFGGGGGQNNPPVSYTDNSGGGGSGYADASIGPNYVLAAGTGQVPPNQSAVGYVGGIGVGGNVITHGGNGLVIIEEYTGPCT